MSTTKTIEEDGNIALALETPPTPPADPDPDVDDGGHSTILPNPIPVPVSVPPNHKEEGASGAHDDGCADGPVASSLPTPPNDAQPPVLPILPPEITLEMVEMISSLLASPSDAALTVAAAHAIAQAAAAVPTGGSCLVAATELGRVGACEAIVGALKANAHDAKTAHPAIVGG